MLLSIGCSTALPGTCWRYAPVTGAVVGYHAAFDDHSKTTRASIDLWTSNGHKCAVQGDEGSSVADAIAFTSASHPINSTIDVLWETIARECAWPGPPAAMTIAGVVLLSVAALCVVVLAHPWLCRGVGHACFALSGAPFAPLEKAPALFDHAPAAPCVVVEMH